MNAGEAYVSFVCHNAIPKSMTLDEVRVATKQTPLFQNLMHAIQSSDRSSWNSSDPSDFRKFKDELSIVDGVILRDHRLVIPTCLQEKVIQIAHSSHQGIVKTKQLIREKVWFPGIDRMVEQAVKACTACQASYPGLSKREPIQPTPLPSAPWSEVAIDFPGPFPSDQYLLVVIDKYSRFPEVEIVHSTSAEVVISRLNTIFARHGFPNTVKSDNGPPFQSSEFASFAKGCGFKHRKVMPLWPEANGEVERLMGTLNMFVRVSAAGNKDWKAELQNFLMHYRATPHSATNVSPFEALTGRKMNVGLPDIPKHLPVPAVTRMGYNDCVSKSKMKAYADKKRHTKPSLLTEGDHVLVKQRKLNKLTPPYHPKPYTVIHKNGSMITAERNGHSITRNSVYFRPVQAEPLPEDEESSSNTPKSQPDGVPPVVSDTLINPPVSSPVPTPPSPKCVPRRNPQRNTTMPKNYSDYVLT